MDGELPMAGPRRARSRRALDAASTSLRVAVRRRDAHADIRSAHHDGHRARTGTRAASGARDAGPAPWRDPGRDRRPRSRLCGQPVRSAQTLTLGLLGGRGRLLLRVLAPIIGWLGVAVTGSDTSSNALFGAVQVAAADHTGISATLLAAANASGGVLGKMTSAGAPRHRGCGRRYRGPRGRTLPPRRGLEHRPAADRSAHSSTCNRRGAQLDGGGAEPADGTRLSAAPAPK